MIVPLSSRYKCEDVRILNYVDVKYLQSSTSNPTQKGRQSLTEEHRQVFRAFDEAVQHLVRHLLDLVLLHLMHQPVQNLFLHQQVSLEVNRSHQSV